ncbi:dGTPase [Agaribacter flavus]|uniref:DGTPase n=1 Tax=Agaribacter flavus TaxID=1902781 RepID=A0ABV7FVF9_9ALTE
MTTGINFKTKFLTERALQSASRGQAASISALETAYESDRGRILNSVAIRRLQQKTQVFPLERNAAVRSRLTHSMEVMQVGRYITRKVFSSLSDNQKKQFGLDGLERVFETVVEMACLLHDVGNPPYGHFGEDTIVNWFKRHIDQLTELSGNSLDQHQRQDLISFEGNAQAIRIVHSLQALNLSYTQIASILKYTRCAAEPKPIDNYLKKKPGYYLSEKGIVSDVLNALNIEAGCRHPVAYIMEAADDIAYCIADLEDAVEKGIMSTETLSTRLVERYQEIAKDFGISDEKDIGKLADIVARASKKAADNHVVSNSEYFVSLRVSSQHIMVQHAATRFITHIEACYHGSFNASLLEDKSPAHAISASFKAVAFDYAFSHHEVEQSELQGYQIISGLLDKYGQLLALTESEFSSLFSKKCKFPLEKRLLKKLADKHVNAYKLAVANEPQSEFYFRCRMVQDNISGMTDHFAYDDYRTLFVCE